MAQPMRPDPNAAPVRPDAVLRWTWTHVLTSEELGRLADVCLEDALLTLRVRPSGNPSFPHLVKVRVEAGPDDAQRVLENFDESRRNQRIG